jgi:hypothetical protein
VFPIVLGSGARLFGDHPDAAMLGIVEHRQFGSGVTLLVYRPRAAAVS